MNISVERLPDCRARLSAEVPSPAVAEERVAIVREFVQHAKIPGFRVGKVPVPVVEKRFADRILGELKERLARKVYAGARTDHDLGILGIVQVERDQVEGDGSYFLAVEVVVEPEVEVSNYRGIAVKIPKLEVTDELVDAQVEEARRRAGALETVERPAAQGDGVIIDYRLADGTAAPEAGESDVRLLLSAESMPLMVPDEEEASQAFSPVPGMAAALAGHRAGDVFVHEASYPDDFQEATFAGATLAYDVTVREVKEIVLPEVDDALAIRFGAPSLEEFRKHIAGIIAERQTSMQREMIDSQVLSHLNKEVNFDLPSHLVFQETQNQVNRMVMQGYERGLTEDDFSQHEEELVKSAEARAKSSVQTSFILEQIAEKEGIRADERDLIYAVQQIAEQRKRPFKKVLADLKRDDSIPDIARDITLQKTIAFLREEAHIIEEDDPDALGVAPAALASGEPAETAGEPAETAGEESAAADGKDSATADGGDSAAADVGSESDEASKPES